MERGGGVGSNWPDLLTGPTMQAVVAVLVLCVLIAAGFWLVARFRDYAADDRQDPISPLPNFEEMLRRGEITAAEFRKIQSRSGSDSVTEPTESMER